MDPEANSLKENVWPALPVKEWEATRATLHMWTQIVGKVKLELCPPVNHWWEVTLHVNSRGLTTLPIPYEQCVFEIQFDFLKHVLEIQKSNGQRREMKLEARSVADFYREIMDLLGSLEIHVEIWPMPVEIANPIRFNEDKVHASYDPEFATRFWTTLVSIESVLEEFRARFQGKTSPVHFFWGSFDLAVTRFSGRRAPERPGADAVMREAYSHEVISVGFWPGNEGVIDASFYAYAAPEPAGFAQAPVLPAGAFYGKEQGEFLLPYEKVRASGSPAKAVLDFAQSTYEAGASLGKWDRTALERDSSPARS